MTVAPKPATLADMKIPASQHKRYLVKCAQRRERIRELHQRGLTQTQIAEREGVSRQRVWKILQ